MKKSRLLQAKVGAGAVKEESVAEGQTVIDENDFDFQPLAKQYLKEFQSAIEEARNDIASDFPVTLERLTAPVMQLKGNAAMFSYELVTMLSSVMLNFLESVTSVDNDALDIAEAHYKTLKHLVTNKVVGDGGQYGSELQKELQDACNRYFSKKSAKEVDSGDDAFFVDF